MEYCTIFIAEYQYNQYNNNIIVPSADYNNFYKSFIIINVVSRWKQKIAADCNYKYAHSYSLVQN